MADRIDHQLAAWLRERLGSVVGVAVAPVDRLYPIWPEEETSITGAVESRRVEFSVGRWCARQALDELGIAPQPIPAGARREPVWPEGSCGSITHSGGLCAAVAARTAEIQGLGIDIVNLDEALTLLHASTSVFAGERELRDARTALGAADEQARAVAVLFSAKESAIKAMSAKFDRFVEFTEVTVRLDGAKFRAECRPFGTHAEGWWAVRGRYCFTAAVLG